MFSRSQRSKQRNTAHSALDEPIRALTIAKDGCGVPPAQIALGSACVLLTTIKNTMDSKDEYTDLGLSCADVCETLDRGLSGRKSDDISDSAHKAIEKLTTTMANIQRKIDERNKRNAFSRALHAQGDKDAIAAWKQDFTRILQIFHTELQVNILVDMAGVRKDLSAIKEGASSYQLHYSNQASSPVGELPPPAPKAFFGRDSLIEDIVGRAEKLESIALIGAGGIGKTSIALTVLHDQRIKKRFGDNRHFIRCDKFTPSAVNFLAQLSKVIGSSIKNPENLTSLQPSLSSKEMILFLDNAESIFDPHGTDAQEIYAIVEELSCFENICLGITSRITTIPPQCKRLPIPVLSMESACDIFYAIYDEGGRSDTINNLIKQLDFHALSITLLATTASHHVWDYDRLAEEWNEQRARVLRTDHNRSLAATIELSLASPMFRKLGPSARDLLGVVAFFPQGINKNNLRWLFSSVSNIKSTFDTFCALSLTHRTGDFITMLAPIRDHLTPQDPKSSPLLCATRDLYFDRLSVDVFPGKPGFEEAQWIIWEDVNVEHLLNIFTSIDTNVGSVWIVCCNFMQHLRWHKPRKTVLAPKIEGLPDDHHSKPKSMFELSQLLEQVGNQAERRRLLTRALELERGQGNYSRIALVLASLSDANRLLGQYKEAVQQAKEASEIYERLVDTANQADCLAALAFALLGDRQLDAAENAALRSVELLSGKDKGHSLCASHRFLGYIYQDKGEKEKAVHHFKTAINIASPFNWQFELFWSHWSIAQLFLLVGEFDEANTHIAQAKSHAIGNTYNLGRAMHIQADIWAQQCRLEDAKLEALRALEVYENLGAAEDVARITPLVQVLDQQ